ncbi:MAG: biopolymer transporter ExbD [Bacteroidota bacterium]|jgi:biopolymer transport protein ExbD|nr:biopolymer transporter ExbD [Bacteroidota bacterium]
MSKFKKKSNASQDIPTAALPDIIFMLLFFFMVTTVLRKSDLLVEQSIPRAEQLQKIQRKSLVSHIYVGKPKRTEVYGSEPRIQVNDVLIEPKDIPNFVEEERNKLAEAEREQMTMSLKVDEEAKMGIISDVQQQLKEVNARRVLYATVPRGLEN